MTTRNTNITGQPTIQDLMVRFLASRSDAASAAVETGEGEVEPHEVAAGFRVDPRAAWNDATTNHTTPAVPLPAEWAVLVNQPATAFAVAMAAGNFPQRVRDLHPLLKKFNPAELRPTGVQHPAPGLNALRAWIEKHSASQPIIAAGLARVLGNFETAEKLLPADEGNELAALLWHRGQCEEALAAWNAMPESPAVLFNRGMATLFLGKTTEAKPLLTRAVDAIPETSGWNALARLYLAVAEIHG